MPCASVIAALDLIVVTSQVTESAETQSIAAEAQRKVQDTQSVDTGLDGEAQGLTDEVAAEQLMEQGIDPAMLETMGGGM